MTSLDYCVLVGYFVLTIALGSLTFARQKGLQDYFVASHSTPWLASMASLVATTISAVTFIGIPALSFKKDLTDLQIYLGFPVAAIAAAVLIVPFYYRQDILTAYQFLERRGAGAPAHASCRKEPILNFIGVLHAAWSGDTFDENSVPPCTRGDFRGVLGP